MLFSVLALLVVAAVVMKLAATQLQSLKPGGAAAGTPASAAQQAADRVNQAMERAARAAAAAASQ